MITSPWGQKGRFRRRAGIPPNCLRGASVPVLAQPFNRERLLSACVAQRLRHVLGQDAAFQVYPGAGAISGYRRPAPGVRDDDSREDSTSTRAGV